MALHIRVINAVSAPLQDTTVSVFGGTVIGGGETLKTDTSGEAILKNAIRGTITLIIGPEKLQMYRKFDYTEGSVNTIQVIDRTLSLVTGNLEACGA